MLMAVFSLVLGTVAGLSQIKLKRLLAFSTISHVGFILITLTVCTELSISALIFYIIQYTTITCLTFLVIITYEQTYLKNTITYMTDLEGTGRSLKLLTFTLVICLFSISGIPPLVGFYAKLIVLNSSIVQGQSLLYIIAIICSIISASYYMKIIKIMMFSTIDPLKSTQEDPGYIVINNLQSYTMSLLTLFTCLFILDPNIILNSTELVAITYFTA
jgi:NADH-ubiquinone oxidoreductase chain 2